MMSRKNTLIVICTLFLFFYGYGCTPSKSQDERKVEERFQSFVVNLNEHKWKEVWNMLSVKSQKAFSEEGYKRMKETVEALPPEIRKKEIKSLGRHYDDFLKMSPEEFFIYVMEKTEGSQEFSLLPLSVEISSVDVVEDKAEIKFKNQLEKAVMIKEDGEWKVEFET